MGLIAFGIGPYVFAGGDAIALGLHRVLLGIIVQCRCLGG
jgi:hypothetical protein